MIDLSSAKAKLGRAKLHIIAANRLAKESINPNLYRISKEINRNGCVLVKVIEVKPLPTDFCLAVGDAASNLRSVLDHIVFAFASARKELTRKEQESIQFPIVGIGSKYPQQRKRWLSLVPGKARTLVDTFQPYHRRKRPQNRILEQLQAINNWDKHRSLPITASLAKRSTFSFQFSSDSPKIGRQIIYNRTMKKGTILARFYVTDLSPNVKVTMNSKIVVVPVFDKGMQKEIVNLSVLNRLAKIYRFIENDLLPKFEALA